MRQLLQALLRIARFGIVGLLATGVYALGVLVLVDGYGVGTIAASVVAYLVATPVSFLGQKYFTFSSRGAVANELPRFLVVQGANLGAAAGVMHVVTQTFGLSHYAGIVAVIATIPLLTYLLLSTLVFEQERRR